MATKKRQRTQKTRPAEGKPINIPVPKRGDVDKVLKRAMKVSPASRGKPK